MTKWKHIDFEVPDWGEFAQGPQLWTPPTFSDDFNRSDGALEASADWQKVQGQADIVNQQCDLGIGALYRWDGAFPADQFCEAAAAGGAASEYGVAAVRLPLVGTGGYMVHLSRIAPFLASLQLHRIEANGSATLLAASGFTAIGLGGDVVRIEADGNSVRGFVNGTQHVSATDSIWTAGACGVSNLTGSRTSTIDNVMGGEL